MTIFVIPSQGISGTIWPWQEAPSNVRSAGRKFRPRPGRVPIAEPAKKSGWNEDASGGDGLDLPGEDFDYEKFTQAEFGSPAKAQGRQLLWKVTAVILLVLAVSAFVFQLFFR
jgi:hypothetical protein